MCECTCVCIGSVCVIWLCVCAFVFVRVCMCVYLCAWMCVYALSLWRIWPFNGSYPSRCISDWIYILSCWVIQAQLTAIEWPCALQKPQKIMLRTNQSRKRGLRSSSTSLPWVMFGRFLIDHRGYGKLHYPRFTSPQCCCKIITILQKLLCLSLRSTLLITAARSCLCPTFGRTHDVHGWLLPTWTVGHYEPPPTFSSEF